MWRGFSDHLCPRMRGLCLAKGRVDEKRKTMGPPPRKHRYFDAFPVPQSNSILNCPVLGSWRLPYPQLSLKKHPSVLLVLTAYCASSFMITATWCVTKTVVCDANLKRVWTLGNDAATGDTPSMQAPWTLSAGWDPLDIYIYIGCCWVRPVHFLWIFDIDGKVHDLKTHDGQLRKQSHGKSLTSWNHGRWWKTNVGMLHDLHPSLTIHAPSHRGYSGEGQKSLGAVCEDNPFPRSSQTQPLSH